MNTCIIYISTYYKVQIFQLLNYCAVNIFMSSSYAYGQLLESSRVDGCRAGVISSLGLWLNDVFYAEHSSPIVAFHPGIRKRVGENACKH